MATKPASIATVNGGYRMDYVTLNNGVKMPMEGFGVFQVWDKE